MDKIKVFGDNSDNKRYMQIPLGVKEYKLAVANGLTVSQYLEKVDPSTDYSGPLAEMDAYERQLLRYNLPLHTDPKKGVSAARGEYFLLDESQRILFKETIDREAKITLFSDKWDVNRLLSSTRFVSGEKVNGVEIDMSEIEANPMFKVGKGGEFPTVSVDWSATEAYVAKRGVALKWTYEFLRRVQIDLVRTILQRILLADRKASFNYAVQTLINGSTVVTTESLDSACTVAAPITYASWIKWLHSSFGDYTPDVCVTTLDTAVKIITMARPNIAPGDVIKILTESKANSIPTISLADNINTSPDIMVVPDAVFGANTTYCLGIDSRFALERIIEVGSDISEAQQFITNQTYVTTQSLNEGYTKIWADAAQILNVVGTD